MNPELRSELIAHLSGFMGEERLERLHSVLDRRTRYLTVVMENIYQPHNASAVIRSCDCFGIMDLHVIENRKRFEPVRGMVKGAQKWVNVYQYPGAENDGPHCIQQLKAKGYRLVATSPGPNDVLLPDLDLEKGPIALLFGTEDQGLSEELLQHADERVKIPMHGFSLSLNISVAAAICLQNLSQRLYASSVSWHLSPLEREEILLDWLRKSLRAGDLLESRFLESFNPSSN